MVAALKMIQYSSLFNEETRSFAQEIGAHGISVEIDSPTNPQIHNSVEWLLPPAILLIITKPFIDSFLQEAGKDAYQGFSASIKKLFTRSKKKEYHFVDSSAKHIEGNRVGFRIELEELDINLKINIPYNLKDETKIDELLNHISPHNREHLLNMVEDFLLQCDFPERMLYLAYNDELNKWVIINNHQLALQHRKVQNFDK